MHPLLRRQLARLGIDPATVTDEAWLGLLGRVSRTYERADQDRYTNERSLLISSEEMQRLYGELKASSERELSEKARALEKSLALADSIREAVLDGILVVDEDRAVVAYNQRFIEMWRIPLSVLELRDDEALIESVLAQLADPAAFLAKVRDLYDRPGECSRDEVRLADGRIFDRFSGPVVSAAGRPFGRLWCFRDLTDARRVAGERQVLTERMASAGRLVASVAHEINNPLSFVMANVDALEERARESGPPGGGVRGTIVDDESIVLLHEMREGLERIRALVDDLRSLARSDDERRTRVDVNAALQLSLHMVTHQIRHRATVVRAFGSVPPVWASPSRLGQVFLNLLVNAAQAIPEGHAADNEIRIVTATEGTLVRIEIHDTGAGIAPELAERIFDPFFTTKAIGEGTGLGLSICKGIVEDHGGRIVMRSEPGRGSCFAVSLPATTAAPDARRRETPGDRPAERRGRILVVDDEPAVRRSLARFLGRQHDVTLCQSAREALARLEGGETFDVILCDLMMPDLTGMDLHDELAARHPETLGRLVFLTGGAFTPRAEAFVASFPGGCLKKPFDWKELSRAVAVRIGPAPAALEAGAS